MSAVFRGDPTVIRSGRGLEKLRQVTRVSNDVAIHLVEADALPGPGWAELSSESHARMTIVLQAIGGHVEHRLKLDRPSPDGPFTMSFTPPGTPIWGYSEGLRRVRALRIDFDLPRISEALSQRLIMPDSPRLFRSVRLRHIAECLADECERPDELSTLYVDSLTRGVCIDFLRLSPEESTRIGGRLAPWQLRRVTEYIMEHLSGTVRLKDLAVIVGLSQSQLTRAFKSSTGLSPHQWQLDARIAKAQQLLLSGSLSQAEVALMTGFAEQSHFCRVFKKIVGSSPGAWQRRQRNPPPDAT
jgi:AraC-like DNA-binding protein